MPEKRKQWLAVLIIIAGIILLIGVSASIDSIIDNIMNNLWHTATNFVYTDQNSDPGGFFVVFTLGLIFFPGVLRRYREAAQKEAKVVWHRRIELRLCICGLIFGPLSILALWRRWAEFMLTNNLDSSNPLLFRGESWRALSIVDLVISITWLAMVGWFIYLAIRHKRQQEIS